MNGDRFSSVSFVWRIIIYRRKAVDIMAEKNSNENTKSIPVSVLIADARNKLNEADGLIVGSPVYFASANGSLIAFLDRLLYGGKVKCAYKPAAAIASARRAGATATLDELNKYFSVRQMPIVSSQYWCMVHGNTPDEVKQDLEGMQIMRTLGRNMAWLLKCMEAGKKAGVPMPENEPRISTNFIR